jgi:hypothetical protein
MNFSISPATRLPNAGVTLVARCPPMQDQAQLGGKFGIECQPDPPHPFHGSQRTPWPTGTSQFLLTMHQAQAGALGKFANQVALPEIGRTAKAFYAAGDSVPEPLWGQPGARLKPAHSSNLALKIRPHRKFKLLCDFHPRNWLSCGISRRPRQQRQRRRRPLSSLAPG